MSDLHKEREAFAQTEFNTFGLDVKDFKTIGEYFMFIGWLLRSELEKTEAKAVPEGFKLVPNELSEVIAEKLAEERVQKPRPENDPVWVEIAERAYKSNLLAKKWELVREYKILTEASESEIKP